MQIRLAELRCKNADLQTKLDISHSDQIMSPRSINNRSKTNNTQIEDRKYLTELTNDSQAFLYAMKNLQRVIHNKEPNVLTIKNQFESCKNKLENVLIQCTGHLQAG